MRSNFLKFAEIENSKQQAFNFMDLKNINTLYSMTGFGRATGEYNGKLFTVELKALNSKTLDLNLRIPSFYREKEAEIRNKLSEKLTRGKIDFMMFVELSSTNNKTSINKDIFISYYKQLKELYLQLGETINNETIVSITRFPDIFESQHEDLDSDEWSIIVQIIDNSIEEFLSFRKTEGESLRKDLTNKIKNIYQLCERIIPFEAQRKESVRQRLLKSLSELSEPEKFDPNRFEQELFYYIEKQDINEEKVRLKQHLDYFSETLDSGGDIGRKLGFIAQEIGREINTLGAKANHIEIQKLVVLMKDELEQIKEQLLNVL